MNAPKINFVIIKKENASLLHRIWEDVRQSFREFLKVPTVIIVGFLVVCMGANIIDHEKFISLDSLMDFLKSTIFNDPKATGALMRTIASSIITVTSLSLPFCL